MPLTQRIRFETRSRILRGLIPWFVLAAVFPVTGTANALETFYSDNFSGNAAVNLAGTTPDVTIGSNTWEGNTGFMADGSLTSVVGGIYLPFTPTASWLYTITASFTTASSSTGWIGVGFSAGSPTSTGAMNSEGRGWVIVHKGIQSYQSFIGPGTATGATASIVDPSDQLSTISITLNATSSNVASWTYSSTLRVNTTDYTVWTNVNAGMTSANQISSLGMSAFNGTGKFTSFSVVPEPSTYVLGCLAGVMAVSFMGFRNHCLRIDRKHKDTAPAC